jgi:hypothetical protein
MPQILARLAVDDDLAGGIPGQIDEDRRRLCGARGGDESPE